MKNILLATIALFALASCSKFQEANEPDLANGSNVTVSFIAEPNDAVPTRAFFDQTTTTESWESSLNSLTILVFDPSGKLIVQRNFSTAEISAKKATFALPRSSTGTTCSFYAIANRTLPSIGSTTVLAGVMDEEPSAYNGAFADVTTKSQRTGGFVMSGMLSKTVGAVNTVTDVPITIKRVVAKVAVQTTMASDFSTRYPGKVRINKTTISRTTGGSSLISASPVKTSGTPFSYAQAPVEASSAFNNLFYIYENSTLAAGSRVLLTLDATYDRDGNFTSTDDQVPITYTCEINGTSGNGSILRNGYYRVSISISGLVGQDINAVITVANWETPVTQTVNLGQ